MRFGIFKIMAFSYICIVEDKVVLHNIKMYGKTMILKLPSHSGPSEAGRLGRLEPPHFSSSEHYN